MRWRGTLDELHKYLDELVVEARESGRRGTLKYKQYDPRTMSGAAYWDNGDEDDSPPWETERRNDGTTQK